MRKLLTILLTAIIALSFSTICWAQSASGSSYEYTSDEIAENQGAVAYWYAWGYNYAYGHFPLKYAELKAHGLPLRQFLSPHTGAEIDFDDGVLDFDGDMTYAVTGDNVEIQIRTTSGITVLPGMLNRTNECGESFCCEIMLCDEQCWDVCDDADAACKIVQWMMWKSFETHECRYGYRPVDEQAWFASGFAPIDSNWKAKAPNMDIKYVYGKCGLKKAFVKCCAPCVVQPACSQDCKPKCENKCSSAGNPCETKNKCDTGCNKCKPKSNSKCKSDCGTCETKSKCDTGCNKCKPKCETKCDSGRGACETKSKCNTCREIPAAAPSCDNCSKCKPKCEDKCGKCRPFDRGSALSDVMAVGAEDSPCACDSWLPYSGNALVQSLGISITASEGTAGPMQLLVRDRLLQQVVLIELPGPIDGSYFYSYTFATPVDASDLYAAVLINAGTDPATITSLRVVGLGETTFNYVFVEHTCPGAVVGPGGCTRMEIN